MTANEVETRIADLTKLIAIKQAELDHRCNRRVEISAKPNSPIKQKIIARYRTEIKQMTDELNNLKTELWGLQEVNLPAEPAEYVW